MSEHGEVSDAIKDVDAEAAHTTAHADRVATPDEEQTADAQSGALTDSVRGAREGHDGDGNVKGEGAME